MGDVWDLLTLWGWVEGCRTFGIHCTQLICEYVELWVKDVKEYYILNLDLLFAMLFWKCSRCFPPWWPPETFVDKNVCWPDLFICRYLMQNSAGQIIVDLGTNLSSKSPSGVKFHQNTMIRWCSRDSTSIILLDGENSFDGREFYIPCVRWNCIKSNQHSSNPIRGWGIKWLPLWP